MSVAIISLAGLLATVVLSVRQLAAARAAGEDVPRSAVAWGAVFMLIQAFVGAYAAMGLVADDPVVAVALNLVLIGCVYVSLSRPRLDERLRALVGPGSRFPHPLAASVLVMLLAGIFTWLALEIPSNHLLRMYPLCILLEWWLIATPMLALFFLAQRRGAAAAVLAAIFHVVGLAQYFIITFKAMPIQPGDLSALGTAAAVSGGYVYTLSSFCLYGMACLAITLLLCQLAGSFVPVRDAERARGRLVVNLLVGLACIAGVTAHVTLIDYYNVLGVQVYTWRPLPSYYSQGFLPCFISSAQVIAPRKPEGYSVEVAEALLAEHAAAFDAAEGASDGRRQAEQQFDAERPTVIAIMNETFSDLSIYQNMHANYQGPQYFKTLADCLQRGVLYVSAYGGGTCNSEFEFLTGNSMAYLGSGTYPYTIYNLEDVENLAGQFKELGYRTTAMHPNHAANWNRENVYRQFGFDDFLAIEDFQGAERLRDMVTDRATYDKIFELLEEDSTPQFIFDVTMQNHSGYKTGLLPADKQETYWVDGMSDAEVNEYLSLIEESDRALEEFIERLRTLDRKVVVVFFGDHQPFFPDEYNDRWFKDEDPAVHTERLWTTDYLIWANYDVAGREQVSATDDISSNYLGSELMRLIGAPMSDYQKARTSLRSALPALNSTGFADASGRLYLSSAAEDIATNEAAREAHGDLQMMQFLKLFRDGTDVYTKVAQDAPNQTDPNAVPDGN